VITAEVVADTKEVLGGEALEAINLDGGREIVIAKGTEVAAAVIGF